MRRWAATPRTSPASGEGSGGEVLPADDEAGELTPEGSTCNYERAYAPRMTAVEGRWTARCRWCRCWGRAADDGENEGPARDAEAVAARPTRRRASGRDVAANGATGLPGGAMTMVHEMSWSWCIRRGRAWSAGLWWRMGGMERRPDAVTKLPQQIPLQQEAVSSASSRLEIVARQLQPSDVWV